MTVNLHERGSPDMGQRRMRCNLVNELGEEERLPAEPLRGVILREEARQFVAKALTQAGSRPTMGVPASISGRKAAMV